MTEIHVSVRTPIGTFESDVDLPEGLNMREVGHRKVVALSIWQLFCAKYPTEVATQLFDYAGGDPVGFILETMETRKTGR